MDDVKDRTVTPIAEAAADWFVMLRTEAVSPEQEKRFAAWVAESPVNVREYLGIAGTWGALKAGKSWPEASTEELIALARQSPRVTELPGSDTDLPKMGAQRRESPPVEASFARPSRRKRTIWAVAASLFVVTAASLLTLDSLLAPGVKEYSTARGEQRSIVLTDGSIVQLNTLSRLIVRLDGRARRIELPEGEAFFRVAHDASRPFIVATPAATVRAIGTEFNVYSRSRDTEVAVLKGRVGVTAGTLSNRKGLPAKADSRGNGAASPIILGARESIVLDTRGRTSRAAARKPEEVILWIQRRLVFNNEMVAGVIEEFNRYNARQLRISDSRLATLRVSGVFDADDPGALVKYLERIQGSQMFWDSPSRLLESQPDPGVH
jgi:transmembrane sensor